MGLIFIRNDFTSKVDLFYFCIMSQAAPTSGSNTITLTNNVPKDDQQADVTKKVLKLKSKKNVKWDESTAIDNEGMGKKSSKSMFIFSLVIYQP